MDKPQPPKELYLYWYVPDSGNGFFTTQTYEINNARYILIEKVNLCWSPVEIDENGMAVSALTGVLGEKQKEITDIKAKIQELLCIGADIQG